MFFDSYQKFLLDSLLFSTINECYELNVCVLQIHIFEPQCLPGLSGDGLFMEVVKFNMRS